MAMTKKEQAQVAALQDELARARAFHLTGPAPARDLPPPTAFMELFLTRGWDGWVADHRLGDVYRVEKACSSAQYHGRGWERPSSQKPLALYSTEARALRAVRAELEQAFAQVLVDLDARLAALEGGGQ